MNAAPDYTEEDVGNIVLLEHVNLQHPNQPMAILFYVVGLGLTRDPYISVGLQNMWANIGEQQFHLPTRAAQVIPGHIGLVIPDLEALKERLKGIEEQLKGSCFSWSAAADHVAVTCPWGNHFRCYAPGKFGDMLLGIPYVEFDVRQGAAAGIARFYQQVMRAPSTLGADNGARLARVAIGRGQWLCFKETAREIPQYDGHHIAVYIANFSGPYGFLKERNLLMEDVRNHQFRFKEIVDPQSGKKLFEVEHEVRSLRHPMYQRHFVNRNPEQIQRNYKRGRDALIPFGS